MLAAQQLEGDTSRLNRGLFQLLRVIGNMSDAGSSTFQPEMLDVNALFREVIEKAAALSDGLYTLTYQGLDSPVFCPADRQQLERAVLNLFSNAMKFSPKHTRIHAELHRQGTMLRFSVTDQGSGISDAVRSTLFRRYLRDPGIEDSRYGIGLGMVLIRTAAANHGGTVLVDSPEASGTRITMTLSTEQNLDPTLHAPRLRMDYAGELDHTLLELSESLPPDRY